MSSAAKESKNKWLGSSVARFESHFSVLSSFFFLPFWLCNLQSVSLSLFWCSSEQLFSPPPSSRGGRKPTLKRFSRGNTEQKAKSRDRDLKGTWLTLTVKVTLQCIIRTPVERNQNCSHLSCFHFPFCIPLLLLIFLCFFSFFFLSFSDLSNLI
jgi:hypothetical protein